MANPGRRIALVVHGRFYMFDVARALAGRGHDVHVFTNYPSFMGPRWGVPAARMHGFVLHGVASRGLARVMPRDWRDEAERWPSTVFARWAASAVEAGPGWDAVVAMSGVAEEVLGRLRRSRTALGVMRASSHIRTQRRILETESRRSGAWLESPADWITARECREYTQADVVCVLGEFARRSFVAEGHPPDRVAITPAGLDVGRFRAGAEVRAARVGRILSGAPLTVLGVGTFCRRKGAADMAEAVLRADPRKFAFRFVGPVAEDARELARSLQGRAEFVGKRPEAELPAEYARGDVFCLPTLEDGAAVVLYQALAAGLPLVATERSAALELVREGVNGRICPPADGEGLLGVLQSLEADRPALARMVGATAESVTDIGDDEVGRRWHEALEPRILAARAGRAHRFAGSVGGRQLPSEA